MNGKKRSARRVGEERLAEQLLQLSRELDEKRRHVDAAGVEPMAERRAQQRREVRGAMPHVETIARALDLGGGKLDLRQYTDDAEGDALGEALALGARLANDMRMSASLREDDFVDVPPELAVMTRLHVAELASVAYCARAPRAAIARAIEAQSRELRAINPDMFPAGARPVWMSVLAVLVDEMDLPIAARAAVAELHSLLDRLAQHVSEVDPAFVQRKPEHVAAAANVLSSNRYRRSKKTGEAEAAGRGDGTVAVIRNGWSGAMKVAKAFGLKMPALNDTPGNKKR